jgi:malonyl CoA-acyl carrier protein transacylase
MCTSKTFSDATLREVVDSIAFHTGALLEIVNYNVAVCLPLLNLPCCVLI